MTALRTVERMGRDEVPSESPERAEEAADYPVDHEGRFEPGGEPSLWPLRPGRWRWQPGTPEEAATIARWEGYGGWREWEAEGTVAEVRVGARPRPGSAPWRGSDQWVQGPQTV